MTGTWVRKSGVSLAVVVGLLVSSLAAPPAEAATSAPVLQPPMLNKVSVPMTPEQVRTGGKAYVEPDMAFCADKSDLNKAVSCPNADPTTHVVPNSNTMRIEMYESVGNNDNSYKWDWSTLDEFAYLVNSVPKDKMLYATIYNPLHDLFKVKRVLRSDGSGDQFVAIDKNGAVVDQSGGNNKLISIATALLNRMNLYSSDAERKAKNQLIGGADTMGEALSAGSSIAYLLLNGKYNNINTSGAGVMKLCGKNSAIGVRSSMGTCLSTDASGIYHSKFAFFEQAADSTGKLWNNVVWVTSSNLNSASGATKANTSFAIFGDPVGYNNILTRQWNPAWTQSRTNYSVKVGSSSPAITYIASPGPTGGWRTDYEGEYLNAVAGTPGKSACSVWVTHSRFSTWRTTLVDGLKATKKAGCAVRVMLDVNNAGDVTTEYYQMGKALRKLIGNVILDNVHDKTVTTTYTLNGKQYGMVFGGSANSNNTSLTYDELVVQVNSTIVAAAVNAQNSRLWALANAKTKQVLVKSLSLSPSTANLALNGTSNGVPTKPTLTITPVFNPSNTTIKNLVWTSSDPTIATVSPWGVVTPLKVGVVTITAQTITGNSSNASSGAVGVTAKATITVTDKTINRLGGTDRVGTALLIAQKGWPTPVTTGGNVVLATGADYPDALAGGPLAYQLKAPMLLTMNPSTGLEPAVLNQIKVLKPSKIWILGGDTRVSTAIETLLRNTVAPVERLAGADRYATAVKIADRLAQLQGVPPVAAAAPTESPAVAASGDPAAVAAALPGEVPVDPAAGETPGVVAAPVDAAAVGAAANGVFLVNGQNFPDALSVAPAASRLGSPILLTPQTGYLHASVVDYLNRTPGVTKAYIAGSSASVPITAESLLKSILQAHGGDPALSVVRWSGVDRYDTNVKVNTYAPFVALFKGSAVALATGDKYPDALTGGVFAAKGDNYAVNAGYPLFLVPPSGAVKAGTQAAIRNLRDLSNNPVKTAYVFGSTGSLTDTMVNLHFA